MTQSGSSLSNVWPLDREADDPPSWFLLLFGVVLPVITLSVELTGRWNTEVFFDPLPSPLHILLVAFVPLANLIVWLALRRRIARSIARLALANGCAIGVALWYSILFLPLLPLAAMATIYFGIGLLPLTPLIALIAAIRLRAHLRIAAGGRQIRVRSWPGVVTALAALLLLEAPHVSTRIGLHMANAESPHTRTIGIRWLRAVGSEDLLLRLCYVRSGSAGGMLSLFFNLADPVSHEQVRAIYYRVTGTPFNAVPAPVRLGPERQRLFGGEEFDFEQGGDSVGSRLRGLSLAASRLDGSVDANAALGYLEWTMVLRNEAPLQREARAQIALPPGAVVSRLTLWINGEEREAAFAGRAAVRQAYESVVRRNRDPVLVTTAGRDRIAMQLFPVPPDGEMKVRLGITVPLGLNTEREAGVALPYFHERNFEIGPQLRHAIWLESKTPLGDRATAATLARASGAYSLRMDADDAQLTRMSASISAERRPTVASWAIDNKVGDDKAGRNLIMQYAAYTRAAAPRRLVIVLDESASMREAAPRIAQLLKELPTGIEPHLIVAGDEMIEYPSEDATALSQRVAELDYRGGHDNSTALARGLDVAFSDADSTLLWIHGPQPVLLDTIEPLLQRLQRRMPAPAWYDLQARPGANLIGEQLEQIAAITTLDTAGLQRLIAGWRNETGQLVTRRERIGAQTTSTLMDEERTSDHLVRLWAADEIERLLRSTDKGAREQAVALAQRYQLVTAVSGAVVLETRQQYEAAGLEPVAAGTVPTIPEPETWALIAVVMLVLAYVCHRRFAIHARPAV